MGENVELDEKTIAVMIKKFKRKLSDSRY